MRKTLTYDPSERGEQCDEFPFASTYEGAGKGDGNFSVVTFLMPFKRVGTPLLTNYLRKSL
ncbi:NucA/NucB deoxyribonuclease domain-containing protein [Fictibacillus sp. NRS-1165]|uniref:NucA/NucB deoxyribonuclease domain-containing protein n=1 Tax=Fictibacillus sp. NRS-1165 TaxID=3144463 RepID=UPI003D1F71E5